MRRIVDAAFAITLIIVISVFPGCSGESQKSETASGVATGPPAESEPLTVEDTIEQIINEAWDRLKYNDKSGLYENEFEYLTAQNDFDDYLAMQRVQWMRADSVTLLEVLAVSLFERDSAEVFLMVHFDGPSGAHHELKDSIIVYYHHDRWIKPTASNIAEQLKYEASKGN